MASGEMRSGQRGALWSIAGWGLAALLLLLPWVANAPWTGSDFVIAGVMLGTLGLGIEFAARNSGSLPYRLGAVTALVSSLLIIHANGAVGMIGSEDNPYNLLFAAVLVVALVGSLIAWFRPAGMMRTMVAAAAVHLGISAGGLAVDPLGGTFSIGMAVLWLIAAALFHRAARGQAAVGATRGG